MPDLPLAARLRAAAQEAREQDPEAPAQPPPGPQVWLRPELAEAIAEVLEAAGRERDEVLGSAGQLAEALEAAEAAAK